MTTTTSKATPPKTRDSIVAEVRRTKVKLLEKFNYDMVAMGRDARARQSNSGHPVIAK